METLHMSYLLHEYVEETWEIDSISNSKEQ